MSKRYDLVYLIIIAAIIGLCLFPNYQFAAAQELTANSSQNHIVVEGTIYDENTGETIPHVTVQITGTGKATKANSDGRYRLILDSDDYEIKVSHVGYYSQKFQVSSIDKPSTHDIYLKTSIFNLGERNVYTRAYDPAQRIIAEAIRRKKDILSQINDYSFDAYTRVILKNADKPDSHSVFLIAESQSTSYWEQPDQYKEVITGRYQSANIPADANLVSVGEMLNFNRNRIDLGRYDVVSPTAHDAMEHYNYYLLDTLYIDDKSIFVLEVEPKNEYQPLFVGEIQIADSTFDVVKVDVGFSRGVQLPFIENVLYYQSMAQIEDRYWLPVEIGFSGTVTFDVPFPGIPQNIDFSHIASVHEYRIDVGHKKGTFGEYEIEVDEKADDIDSTLWLSQRTIPLTDLETRGYERIDSIKNAPKPIHKQVLKGLAIGLLLVTVGEHDLFHFNRVEGPYAGFGLNPDNWIPNTRLRMKTGYAFDEKLWQYEYGFSHRLWENRKLWLGAYLKDEIVHRPTIVSGTNYNATAMALLMRVDPFDYYREKGGRIDLSFKPVNHTRLKLGYEDYRQLSNSKNTDYGIFGADKIPRYNPPIADGRMRSIFATLSYDSRKLIKSKRRDIISSSRKYIRVEAGIEYASPDLIDNDFDFSKWYVHMRSRFMLTGVGSTSLRGYAGSSDGYLPPQKLFVVDFRDPGFFKSSGMNTSLENNFGGDRVALIYGVHDFGANMFRNTGDRYLQKIPFGLSLHGGLLWIENKRPPVMHDQSLMTAPTVYSEIGFGLSNLTPFMMPFNLTIDFTWQLSTYNTEKFSFVFDFRL